MKTAPSITRNRGTTVHLDSVEEAIQIGADWFHKFVARLESQTGKVTVGKFKRDGEDEGKGKTMNAATFAAKWKRNLPRWEACVEAITKGDPKTKQEIAGMVELLRDLAIEIQPTLAQSHRGYQRAEDGVTAAPELVAAGEEQCCFKRKRAGDDIGARRGEGAYRIVINTDVAWWGRPTDNAALMGALVVLLQSCGPVEIWIQQGWLGSDPCDGVTLFKLDFNGAFDPTLLAFWLGHHDKDSCFSRYVNLGVGRQNTSTSTTAEMEADLYMRGDWMTLCGIKAETLEQMSHTERLDVMAKWAADTAMQILHPPGDELVIEA